MNWSARWVYWAALFLLVTPLGLGAVTWLAPGAAVDEHGRGVIRTGTDSAPPVVGVDTFAGRASRTAPFRPDGRPSGVRYDPNRSEVQMQEYSPPKPVLTLSGILDGSTPFALIEGVPGLEGPMVLGVGDTLGGLKVRKIKDGVVTVTGMDTTWTLRIKQQ